MFTPSQHTPSILARHYAHLPHAGPYVKALIVRTLDWYASRGTVAVKGTA